jgi:hypothetical protein
VTGGRDGEEPPHCGASGHLELSADLRPPSTPALPGGAWGATPDSDDITVLRIARGWVRAITAAPADAAFECHSTLPSSGCSARACGDLGSGDGDAEATAAESTAPGEWPPQRTCCEGIDWEAEKEAADAASLQQDVPPVRLPLLHHPFV